MAVKSQAQLDYLLTKNHTYDDNSNLLFTQYGISVAKEDGKSIIREIKSKKIFLKCEEKIFLEVFQEKYLVATVIDPSYLRRGSSTVPSLLPRNISFIVPIPSVSIENIMYKVDFKGRIVHDATKADSRKDTVFYILTEINLERNTLMIKNAISGEVVELPLIICT